MAKPATRAFSRHSREAASLFGMLIQQARIARDLTVAEVAERAGMSRGLVHRIESGDMGCSIGAVFEVATIVGVCLFEAEPGTLDKHLAASRATLALLPKSVRRSQPVVKDDF